MSFVYTIKPGVIITLKLTPDSKKEKISQYKYKTDFAEVVSILDPITNKTMDEFVDNNYIVTKYKVGDTVYDADELDEGNDYILNIIYYTDYDVALKVYKQLMLFDLLY